MILIWKPLLSIPSCQHLPGTPLPSHSAFLNCLAEDLLVYETYSNFDTNWTYLTYIYYCNNTLALSSCHSLFCVSLNSYLCFLCFAEWPIFSWIFLSSPENLEGPQSLFHCTRGDIWDWGAAVWSWSWAGWSGGGSRLLGDLHRGCWEHTSRAHHKLPTSLVKAPVI